MTTDHAALEALKISVLANGLKLDAEALTRLGGPSSITVHEYPTTGGLPFRIGEMYVNAPFDEWFCSRAEAEFHVGADGAPAVRLGPDEWAVDEVFPLPGYIGKQTDAGRRIDDVAMSHMDRVRLSPIAGCAFDCHFCDLPSYSYGRDDLDHMKVSLDVALADDKLPVRHAMISGGTPGRRDYGWFDDMCTDLIGHSPVPMDVMVAARPDGEAMVDRLVEAGVHGLAINIETFGEEASGEIIRQKHRFSRPYFEATVGRAVERLGRSGRVRSLIIPGLEAIDDTLRGVELLASLGCDPVLSPFRPAGNTLLEHAEPPSEETLRVVLREARAIADHHGVRLGPACVPCQHNTLSFPWDRERRPVEA